MAIDCKNYDFVEIACMHRYPIKLTLRDDSVVKGVAVDTQRNDDREECIKICLLYTSPSPRDGLLSRMPSSA